MEEFLLQAPIPGQSLTDEPKNFPWENPADISEPNEALMYHIERINKPAVPFDPEKNELLPVTAPEAFLPDIYLRL